MLDFVNNDALRAGAAQGPLPARPARHQRGRNPSLAASRRRASRWPTADLAAQADLAEHHHVGRHRLVGQRGGHRGGDREVGRRLADAQAAGDVQVDVVGADADAAARLEHRQHHRQAVGVPADHGMARRGEGGGRDQRLDLDQQRPRALDAGEDAGAGDLAAPLGEEQGRRVGDVARPRSDISNTPISSVGPKRFLTVRRMRN
jgi:hypothetical protein